MIKLRQIMGYVEINKLEVTANFTDVVLCVNAKCASFFTT